jgi:hypothetical protein
MNILKSVISKITPDLTFEIPKERIQDEVSKNFPQTYEKLATSITMHDPLVILKKGDDLLEMRIKITAKIPLIGDKYGYFSAKSSLQFNKEDLTVCIKDPKIDIVNINGLPEKLIPNVKKLADVALERFLNNRTIYKIEEDLKSGFIKDIKIDDGKVIVVLGI